MKVQLDKQGVHNQVQKKQVNKQGPSLHSPKKQLQCT